jgi:hypothetical protein
MFGPGQMKCCLKYMYVSEGKELSSGLKLLSFIWNFRRGKLRIWIRSFLMFSKGNSLPRSSKLKIEKTAGHYDA